MKTFYDEVTTQKLGTLAQTMSDLTYLYKQTDVPKKHYQEHLSKPIEEIIESSVQMNLVDTYYKTIKTLIDENPKWFFQALLCVDMKITPSKIKANEHFALEMTASKFMEQTNAKHLNEQILADFNDFKVNGAEFTLGDE